jgi:hypothetical protein
MKMQSSGITSFDVMKRRHPGQRRIIQKSLSSDTMAASYADRIWYKGGRLLKPRGRVNQMAIRHPWPSRQRMRGILARAATAYLTSPNDAKYRRRQALVH